MPILAILFMIFALACVGLFIYIFQVRRNQQALDQEIERLSNGRTSQPR